MKLFLAGNPESYQEFAQFAGTLQLAGHSVLSTWHQTARAARLVQMWRRSRSTMDGIVDGIMSGTPHPHSSGELELPPVFEFEEFLDAYLEQINSADCVVVDMQSAAFEGGYALALGKQVIAKGTFSSLLPIARIEGIKCANDWTGILAALYWKARGREFQQMAGNEKVN